MCYVGPPLASHWAVSVFRDRKEVPVGRPACSDFLHMLPVTIWGILENVPTFGALYRNILPLITWLLITANNIPIDTREATDGEIHFSQRGKEGHPHIEEEKAISEADDG